MARQQRTADDGDGWYRTVYEAHATELLAYFLRRAQPDDSHDLVAEVFLVAWRRRMTAPDEPQLRAWLFKVARNVLRNHRRGTSRRRRLRERLRSTSVADAPREPFADGDVGSSIRRALSRLREPDREILQLAAWEDCSTAELAAVLGCSPNAAAVRLHRARDRLRRALADDEQRERTTTSGRRPGRSELTGGDGRA